MMACSEHDSVIFHLKQEKDMAQAVTSKKRTTYREPPPPSENNDVKLIDIDAALLLTSLPSLCERELLDKNNREEPVSPSCSQVCSVPKIVHQETEDQFNHLEECNKSLSEHDCLSNASDSPISSFETRGVSRARAVSLDSSAPFFAHAPFESLSAYMNSEPTDTSVVNVTNNSPKPLKNTPVMCAPRMKCKRKQISHKINRSKTGSLCLRKRICQRRQEEQRHYEKHDRSVRSKMVVSPSSYAKDSENIIKSINYPHQQKKLFSSLSINNDDQSSDKSVKTILRRKFSWKNYPELEAFLIANREEYLRHSALNYTVQQKQYNNRLTERLVQLASSYGYVFDEEAFSFVTIRDRIRCYYKSYVQSSKKRGLIIGYAARRAGLMTEDELEKSASIAGHIVIPDL